MKTIANIQSNKRSEVEFPTKIVYHLKNCLIVSNDIILYFGFLKVIEKILEDNTSPN